MAEQGVACSIANWLSATIRIIVMNIMDAITTYSGNPKASAHVAVDLQCW